MGASSTLAGPLFTLLLTPIYTRVLAVADYGTVDTLTMFGTVLFLLGASVAMWREVSLAVISFDAELDQELARRRG